MRATELAIITFVEVSVVLASFCKDVQAVDGYHKVMLEDLAPDVASGDVRATKTVNVALVQVSVMVPFARQRINLLCNLQVDSHQRLGSRCDFQEDFTL
jgi:hypothetical protein